MTKRKVHLAQVNHAFGRNVFLPYSAGMLWAYAAADPVIKADYELAGFSFLRDSLPDVVAKLPDDLDVLAVSCYIWNSSYSHAMAKAVKARFPNCLIVMGGPHVPNRSEGYFTEHPFVDLLVHGEGEVTFAELLKERSQTRPDYAKVKGLSINAGGQSTKTPDRERIDDLDKLPSPYLTGLFDGIVKDNGLDNQATQESHRGCLAAGTLIHTMKGLKPIEAVLPGELVLGWDEAKSNVAWNTVKFAIKTGVLPTLKITAGGRNVQATRDHPIFTKRGWVSAEEIRIGDPVLLRVREAEKNQDTSDVFDEMRSDSMVLQHGENKCREKKEADGITALANLQDVQEIVQESRKDYMFDGLQPSGEEAMASRASEDFETEILQGVRRRDDSVARKAAAKNLFKGMCQRSDKLGETGLSKSGEATRSAKEDFGHCEKTVEGTVGEDNQVASGRENNVPPSARKRTEQFREAGDSIFGGLRLPFQIRGMWGFLDRPLPKWDVPESGFCTCRSQEENSDTGSRSILARTRNAELSVSDERLFAEGLEGVHNLGFGGVGGKDGETASEVCWVKVSSVETSNTCDVFDLVGAYPNPNFFANGLLVHNCPYSCSFCLIDETVISTKRGGVPIVDVVAGDEVWTRSGWKKVLKSGKTKEVMELAFLAVKGLTTHALVGTPDHLVRNEAVDGWVEMLRVDSSCVLNVCVELPVAKKDNYYQTGLLQMKEPIPVYDLTVEDAHEYYANGILVHNCDWGSATFTKLRQFSTDRLEDEFKWMARNRIGMLYSADANVGIFARDVDMLERLVRIKVEYGYPQKFRGAYAKNSNDRVFQISKMLNDAGMSKGTTLSFQSMDEKTLEVVKRKNIKVTDFKNLMNRYRDAGIPTYSEMIVGLPGETYDSWADGFDKLLNAAPDLSASVYSCEVLPNAGMNEPAYRELHDIRSTKTPVLFFHASAATDGHVEHYEIVTSTKTLPPADWMRSQMFAWIVQALHCLGLTQKVAVYAKHRHGIGYRRFYEWLLEKARDCPGSVLGHAYDEAVGSFSRLRRGEEWGFRDSRFGDVIWPVEEGGALICMAAADRFYDEVELWLPELIGGDPVAEDVLTLQKETQKLPTAPFPRFSLRSNIVQYLVGCYRDQPCELVGDDFVYRISFTDYGGDLERFAREVVWYGRKGGTFNWEIERI